MCVTPSSSVVEVRVQQVGVDEPEIRGDCRAAARLRSFSDRG